MKRRVLLIDADTDFRDTLTHQLGRYSVEVTTEVDPDKAIGNATADPPEMLVIAVEEPDKAGFRAFQKARKTLPAKLPIILVTKSMSPDSFSKHRSLKVHADEYIDKRDASEAEVVGKIDNLIGLGDLSDDGAHNPAAGAAAEDDLPMELADGDVVLEDHLDDHGGEEDGEFDVHGAQTVGPNSGVQVDQMVAAETDAAFDMLMGDATPPPVEVKRGLPGLSDFHDKITTLGDEPPRLDGMEDSAIPEPVPHKIPDDDDLDGVPAAPTPDADSVPKPIEDSKRLDAKHEESEFASEEPVHVGPPDEAVQAEVSAHDSLSSIPLVDDDLVALDDDAIEEIDESAQDASSPVPQPIGEAANQPSTRLAAQEPSAQVPEPPHENPREPSGAIPHLIGVKEPTTPATETTVTREPIVPEAAKKPGSGAHSPVDLGLDVLAQDAEREQSGVYDRKSLRKIGELERQIAQLKNELERARAAAEAADKGASRESQFIKLRETTLSRETELKQVKTKFDQQSKELAEIQEKLRQALAAKSALDVKSTELDREIDEVRTKNKDLAASLKDATAQASQLEQELDAKTRAAAAAEKSLAQLEKDLTTERATRAASASDSERALRLERDQLLARHKGELAMLRAETEAATELAIVRVREEYEVEKLRAIKDAVEEAQRIAAQERSEALTVVENKHNQQLLDIRRQHADALTAQKNEMDVEIERLKTQIIEAQASGVAAVAAAEGAAKDELERVRGEHAAELTKLGESNNRAMTELERRLEETIASYEAKLDDVRKAHEAEKAELESTHRHAIADLRSRNDQEVAQLTEAAKKQIETHRAELADEQAKHATLLAAANDTAERQLAEQQELVRQANEQLERAKAAWAAEREELRQQHASQIGELQARHEQELAVAQGEHQKAKAEAETAHKQAIEALKAEADRMLRQLEAERDRNIDELRKERDELAKGLSGARDSLQRSQGELANAVQTIAERNHELREHAKAIAERDQRISQLRGEIESLEQENANYQEQVLRAYQKIKADEAMVARARKAMAIALTVLDDQGNPTESSS